MNILFLAANPLNTSRLELAEEYRIIDERLNGTPFRDKFTLVPQVALRPTDLAKSLLRYHPHIVHFSGHGTNRGEIILQNNSGEAHTVSSQHLAKLFGILKDNVACVVLNGCWTAKQAHIIAEEIGCVVGMSSSVGDSTAMKFAAGFYQAIGFGRDIQDAFDLACIEIDLAHIPEAHIPQLLTRAGVRAGDIILCDPSRVLDSCSLKTDFTSIGGNLTALKREIEETYTSCVEFKRLLPPRLWREIRTEAWFDEVYLGYQLTNIENYYTAIEEYLALERGRGKGYIIEHWVKNSNIHARYDAAQSEINAILRNWK